MRVLVAGATSVVRRQGLDRAYPADVVMEG
jgi:hypothetical protein